MYKEKNGTWVDVYCLNLVNGCKDHMGYFDKMDMPKSFYETENLKNYGNCTI